MAVVLDPVPDGFVLRWASEGSAASDGFGLVGASHDLVLSVTPAHRLDLETIAGGRSIEGAIAADTSAAIPVRGVPGFGVPGDPSRLVWRDGDWVLTLIGSLPPAELAPHAEAIEVGPGGHVEIEPGSVWEGNEGWDPDAKVYSASYTGPQGSSITIAAARATREWTRRHDYDMRQFDPVTRVRGQRVFEYPFTGPLLDEVPSTHWIWTEGGMVVQLIAIGGAVSDLERHVQSSDLVDAEQWNRHGELVQHRAVLGVRFEPESTMIDDVAVDSGAARAGMQEGDRLLSIEGIPTSDVSDVLGVLADRRPGDVVTAVLQRDEEERTVTVTLTELPEDQRRR